MNAWIVEALVGSSLLMALVLLVRRPAARAFGARAAYLLWALPALRLVLPPLPGWQALYVPAAMWARPEHQVLTVTLGLVSPADLLAAAARPGGVVLAPRLPVGADAPAAAAVGGWMPDVAQVLLAVWLGGAVLWFGWQMVRYALFVRRAMRGAEPVTTLFGIETCLSDAVAGPLATGILRRRILLPRDFTARYSREERRLAVLHEAAHHDRFDLPANLLALIVLALHWWNPLAHFAYRAFRSDQELACDATVLADAAAGDRYAYGCALVKSAAGRAPAAACALDSRSELKRRLATLGRGRVSLARHGLGAAVGLAVIAAGLVATASGGAAAPVERSVAGVERAAERAAEQADAADRRAEAARRRADIAQAAADRAQARADRAIARVAQAAAARPAMPAMLALPAMPEIPEIPAVPAISPAQVGAAVKMSLASARRSVASACADRSAAAVAARADGEFAALCAPGGLERRIARELAGTRTELAGDYAREDDPTARAAIAQALATLDAQIADAR